MGALLIWNGGNAKNARVLMSDFEDKQRGYHTRSISPLLACNLPPPNGCNISSIAHVCSSLSCLLIELKV